MEADTFDPGLKQAVKIVLKYEIQSLLTRLSDNGEEYIVITASSEDRTCDQLCSGKGEEFVHCANLDGVKESFLNFVTNGDINGGHIITDSHFSGPSAPDATDSCSAFSEVRKNKRKSTPKRAVQKSLSTLDPVPSENRNFVMMFKDEPPVTSTSSETLPQVALDLSSEKSRTELAQTSDKSNDSDETDENVSNGNPETVPMKAEKLAAFINGDVNGPPSSSTYQWMREKIDLKPIAESLPNLSLLAAGMGVYGHGGRSFVNMDASASLASNVSPSMIANMSPSMIAESMEERNLVIPEMTGSTGMNSPLGVSSRFPRQRRKSKKLGSPVGSLGQAAGSGAGQSDLKTTVEEMRKAKSTKRLAMNSEFTDMKRAFIEIGNMAKCLICNKILANKNNRTFHWRSHVGDKRFSCDICNKAFTHPSNMRSHRKIHTDEKPFPCSMCERRFRRRDYLLQHLERFHYNSKVNKPEEEGQSPVTMNGAANM